MEEFSQKPEDHASQVVSLRHRPENIFFRWFFEQVAQRESVPVWIFRLIFCCRCRGRLGPKGHFERFIRGDIREDLPCFREMRVWRDHHKEYRKGIYSCRRDYIEVLYDGFMSDLMNKRYERGKTLAGPAIVYSSHSPPFQMSQGEARGLCGVDKHGRKQQEPSYKGVPFYPVSEGESVARFKYKSVVNPFAAILYSNEGLDQRLILIIRNIWIENPLPKGGENDHLYQRYVEECKDNPQIPLDAVFSPGEIRRYPFLYERQTHIVQTSSTQSLQDFIQSGGSVGNLNQESATIQLLLALLFRIGNGHSSHYTVDPRSKKLELQEVDSLWNPYVLPGGGKPRLGVYSIVFLLPCMNRPADSKVCQRLKEKSPIALLVEWAVKLHPNSEKFRQLINFKNSPATGPDFPPAFAKEEREFNNFISVSKKDFERLREQLEQLQAFLRERKNPTLWDIVEALADELIPIYRSASDRDPLRWETKFANPFERIFTRQSVKEAKEQEEVQTVPNFVESLLSKLPLKTTLTFSEEKALLSEVFNTFETVYLRESRVTDEELRAYVESGKTNTLTLENCSQITAKGLLNLISKNRESLFDLSIGGQQFNNRDIGQLIKHGKDAGGTYPVGVVTVSEVVKQRTLHSVAAGSSNLQAGGGIPEFVCGRAAWEPIGDIGEVPPPDPSFYKILESPCPFYGERKVKETHIPFFMPSTIKLKGEFSEKPLTLQTLNKFFQENRLEVVDEVVESRWMLLTKFPAEGKIPAWSSAKGAYDTPSPLEVFAGVFLYHAKTGTDLLKDSFFCCKAKLSANEQSAPTTRESSFWDSFSSDNSFLFTRQECDLRIGRYSPATRKMYIEYFYPENHYNYNYTPLVRRL